MRNKFVSLKIFYLCIKDISYDTERSILIIDNATSLVQNSDYIRQQAVRDKRLFLVGKSIPEERMREYLRAAGWEQTQEEQWAEKV